MLDWTSLIGVPNASSVLHNEHWIYGFPLVVAQWRDGSSAMSRRAEDRVASVLLIPERNERIRNESIKAC